MADGIDIGPDMRAECRRRGLDASIAELAERQHGVVARRQLLAIGAGRRAIGHRVEARRLHVVHRGVYAVGHRVLSQEARWMAAALACGPDAVLSHRSAAALWGVRPTARRRVDVTVPGGRRGRSGVELHRARLAADEVTALRGIPVTTVARTLLDVAAVAGRQAFERALAEAELRRLDDVVSLAELLERRPRRRGAPAVRAALAARAAGAAARGVTRSELEERFVGLVAAHGLPAPELNATARTPFGTFEVDCAWRARRLAVELDGHAFHASRRAFERDRARDRALQAAGWRVVRVTWRQLADDGDRVAADLGRLLSRAAS